MGLVRKGFQPKKPAASGKSEEKGTKKPNFGVPETGNLAQKLVVKYQRYAEQVVGKLIVSLGLPRMHADDYISAGYMGLVEAAGRFDPTRNQAEFKSYAYLRIKGAVIDNIRQTSELSGRVYKYARALQAAGDIREMFFEDMRRQAIRPRRENLYKVLEYASQSALAFKLSLCESAEELSEYTSPDDPEAPLAKDQDAKLLKRLVDTLPEMEQLVIKEYYFEDSSFAEIARNHAGLSKSWVSRLHVRGLKHLKRIYLKELEEKLA
jgi:RNA polymerase sigma factor for flagellar operon FliA